MLCRSLDNPLLRFRVYGCLKKVAKSESSHIVDGRRVAQAMGDPPFKVPTSQPREKKETSFSSRPATGEPWFPFIAFTGPGLKHDSGLIALNPL